MTAAAHIAEPTQHPDPRQDRPAAPISTRATRFLGVVQALLAFGKELAAALQRDPHLTQARFGVTHRFGTVKISVMLARLARGLRLAEALEAKLARRAHRPDPVRTPRTPSQRKPRSPCTAAPRQASERAVLATLPTAEEIAEHLRTRPAHVVLLQICSDLGILPCDRLWRDIRGVLGEYGGSFLKLWNDALGRTAATNFIPPDTPVRLPKLPPLSELYSVSAETAATGPP